MGILVALHFFGLNCQERGLNFSWEDMTLIETMVVILSSFFNYDTLTLKLQHKKLSYPDERLIFIGRFKVGSVSGKSVALVGSKKVSKSIRSMMQGE